MAELVQIGNSKGIRIPKALIEQVGLDKHGFELKVVADGLLIQPIKQPRAGWQESIQQALIQNAVSYDDAWLEANLTTDEGTDTF